jgi:hypothetical protein
MMLEPENGIVGFFDIMGYQNIIDNNEIKTVADIIFEVIDKLPGEARSNALKLFERPEINDNDERIKFIKNIDKSIKTLLISDSILISLAFNKAVDQKHLLFINWMFFFLVVSLFLRKAFNKGLPLRGVIDTGEYFIHNYIFAGKPIIESYRLSGRLQFSGCALTPNAMKAINELLEDDNPIANEILNLLIFQYLAPLSDKDEKLYLINWFENLNNKDIRQVIVTAFHAHNKDVPRKVLPVIENTEMIVRHSIEKYYR